MKKIEIILVLSIILVIAFSKNSHLHIKSLIHIDDLKNHKNYRYFLPVNINNEVFNLQLDTGSADLILPSNLNVDNLRLEDNLVVKKQSFFAVDYATNEMKNVQGLLGLSYPRFSLIKRRTKKNSLLANMFEQKLIKRKIYSLFLSTDQNSSKIVFGGYSNRFLLEKDKGINWVKLKRHWMLFKIGYKNIQIGEKSLRNTANSLMIDSGNTCLTFPTRILNEILELFSKKYNINSKVEVENYNKYFSAVKFITTEKSKKFPNVTINLGRKTTIFLTPDDYIFNCKKFSNGNYECLAKFESMAYGNHIILGAAFMHSYYSIFDLENLRFGFARSINKNHETFGNESQFEIPSYFYDFKKEINLTKFDLFNIIYGFLSVIFTFVVLWILQKKKIVSKDTMNKNIGLSFLVSLGSLAMYLSFKV